jgi:hypothetical protein
MREAVRFYVPESAKEISARAFEWGREYGTAVFRRREKWDRLRDRNASSCVGRAFEGAMNQGEYEPYEILEKTPRPGEHQSEQREGDRH